MTGHAHDEPNLDMTVPWDDAREERVLVGALDRLARRTRRRRRGLETALAAAVLLLAWQALRESPMAEVRHPSSDEASAVAVDKTPATWAAPTATDAGSQGTTGGVAGTSGLGADRTRGSTGLGGNAGTS